MAENKWVSLFYFTGTSGVIGPYLSLVTLGLRKEWQRWSQTKAMPSVEDFGMSTRYLVPKLIRKYRSPKIVPNFDLDLFEEIWWEHFPLSNLSYCEKVPDGTFLEASHEEPGRVTFSLRPLEKTTESYLESWHSAQEQILHFPNARDNGCLENLLSFWGLQPIFRGVCVNFREGNL